MARDDRAWPCGRVRGLAYLHRALRNRGHRCVRPWWAYRGRHRIDPRATRRRVVPSAHPTHQPPVAVAGDESVECAGLPVVLFKRRLRPAELSAIASKAAADRVVVTRTISTAIKPKPGTRKTACNARSGATIRP